MREHQRRTPTGLPDLFILFHIHRIMNRIIKLIDCKNIQFDSCEFFGCGTYGLDLENSKNVVVNGSTIFECTYGAIQMVNSEMHFNNSSIKDCKDLVDDLVSVLGGTLYMYNVSIHNNETGKCLVNTNELTDEQSIQYYSLPGLRHSFFLPQGVCIFDNTCGSLTNDKRFFNVLLGENTILEN